MKQHKTMTKAQMHQALAAWRIRLYPNTYKYHENDALVFAQKTYKTKASATTAMHAYHLITV